MKNDMFCKCGNILRLERTDIGFLAICSCGFAKRVESDFTLSLANKKKEEIGLGIISKTETSGFPHTCKKCRHGECDITDLGAQYADESNVYLYKCKKCGFVERQADGTGNS